MLRSGSWQRRHPSRSGSSRKHLKPVRRHGQSPTLGVFTASEQGNRERIYGVSFSMPIPSGSRSARYSQALAQENAAREDVDLAKRELE
ncbi:TolC family protein [Pseudomonas aeruginosa]|uniref:TolC family protein n=1 Tax=Pseudomonas aeruginosa TaxID=287 RepID=UPI001CF6CB8D|nr:TolC family protein [Pseudomonas aeruginosa]